MIQEPGPALEPVWTLKAPSEVQRLSVIDGGDLMVEADNGSAIVSREGVVRGSEAGRADPAAPKDTWFEVPGGWCDPALGCVERDPATSFRLAGENAWLEGRSLVSEDWRVDGVARALPLDDTRLLVQLGSEAGPWALLEADGIFGPLLGHGFLAVTEEGRVAIAQGDTVRAFRVP